MPIIKETLDIFGPQLKVVGTMSVGLEHIDLVECQKRGVKVGYTPNVLTESVAEVAVTLTLATARRLEEAFQAVRSGVWGTKWENALWMTGKQIFGSVIGIVGLGRIGIATAKRLAAFQPAKIVYTGNSPKVYAEDIGAVFLSFEELLEVSDYVIATCSINETSKGLFGAEAFKRMKPSAIFINVTRGALVDQEALYDALSNNKIAAAGLDVTTPEPLPPDHKLLSLRNFILTPHIGSATTATRNAMCELTVDNILAGLSNQPLPSPAF
uniref:Glyoxylate reductase/hydroxypyruvate reductase n=1 Tax=Arion vulgaris TaxID=1028688 RepID=A0A0B7A6L8_9EUPU